MSLLSEFRSRVKFEVAVLGSPSLIVPWGRKATVKSKVTPLSEAREAVWTGRWRSTLLAGRIVLLSTIHKYWLAPHHITIYSSGGRGGLAYFCGSERLGRAVYTSLINRLWFLWTPRPTFFQSLFGFRRYHASANGRRRRSGRPQLRRTHERQAFGERREWTLTNHLTLSSALSHRRSKRSMHPVHSKRFLAMSTFSPANSRSSNGMIMCVCVCARARACVDGMTTQYVGISSHQFIPYCASAIHKHTHPQTIWGQRTDGAKSGHCPISGFYYRSTRLVISQTESYARSTTVEARADCCSALWLAATSLQFDALNPFHTRCLLTRHPWQR